QLPLLPSWAHLLVQSLQAKQNALLQQLDSLDQEREELQASLGEAEGDRARLELLDTLQQEKQSLEQSVSKLREDVSRLEEQAQELKEREKLLVFFPELHVPVETQFESTGNIAEDMEKQLQANDIRIGVLEQENTRLRAALAKLKVAAQQGVLQVRLSPSWGWELAGEGHTCWGAARSCSPSPAGPRYLLQTRRHLPLGHPLCLPIAPSPRSSVTRRRGEPGERCRGSWEAAAGLPAGCRLLLHLVFGRDATNLFVWFPFLSLSVGQRRGF
uniref:Uncharacterized protein n=1 Tax=Anas zonorhyncha TaxID=75864 RepID=A0A8B9VIZ3_9AVES